MTLLDKIKLAKRVYIIGNGGSYANAIHIANDLLSCGIRAYTLDPAFLTASANDIGYEYVFSRWIGIVGERGDLLICLSGSGKSPNILNAITMAEDREMYVEKVFGAGKGLDMQESENAQLVLGHELMRKLRENRSV